MRHARGRSTRSRASPRSKGASTACRPRTFTSTSSARSTPSWTCAAPSSCSTTWRGSRRLLAASVRSRFHAAAHGVLPLPAPATLGAAGGAPARRRRDGSRARHAHGRGDRGHARRGWGPLPPLTLERVGYGAGTATSPTGRTSSGSCSERLRLRDRTARRPARDESRRPLLRARSGRRRALLRGGGLDVWTVPA